MTSYEDLCFIKKRNYYLNVRTEIKPLLPDKMDYVLEIGCGAGDTLAWLKNDYNCKWTAGVELFTEAAEAAKSKVDILVEGNIEQLQLPFKQASFDLILCLDVLEHLSDPWNVIQQLHVLLKPGAVLIASIPNVRHFSVMRDLFTRGRWDYKKDGILDKTHFRFFTRQTALELLESSGLVVDKVHTIGKPEGIKQKAFNIITLALMKYLFEYQYLIRASNVLRTGAAFKANNRCDSVNLLSSAGGHDYSNS